MRSTHHSILPKAVQEQIAATPMDESNVAEELHATAPADDITVAEEPQTLPPADGTADADEVTITEDANTPDKIAAQLAGTKHCRDSLSPEVEEVIRETCQVAKEVIEISDDEDEGEASEPVTKRACARPTEETGGITEEEGRLMYALAMDIDTDMPPQYSKPFSSTLSAQPEKRPWSAPQGPSSSVTHGLPFAYSAPDKLIPSNPSSSAAAADSSASNDQQIPSYPSSSAAAAAFSSSSAAPSSSSSRFDPAKEIAACHALIGRQSIEIAELKRRADSRDRIAKVAKKYVNSTSNGKYESAGRWLKQLVEAVEADD